MTSEVQSILEEIQACVSSISGRLDRIDSLIQGLPKPTHPKRKQPARNPVPTTRYQDEVWVPGSSRTGGVVDMFDSGFDPEHRGRPRFTRNFVSAQESRQDEIMGQQDKKRGLAEYADDGFIQEEIEYISASSDEEEEWPSGTDTDSDGFDD